MAGSSTRRGFRVSGNTRRGVHRLAVILACLGVSWLALPTFAMTPPGTVIANQASLAYTDLTGDPSVVVSNQVDITTVVIRTDATLEFLRVVSGAGSPVPVGPTACLPGGPAVPLPDPVLIGGTVIDPNTPQELADSQLYHTGEPLFLRLEDGDQNLDPAARETIEVNLTSTPLGDTERIRMTETADDSGVFAGYIQTTSGAATPGDCVLQVAADGAVEGQYDDPADGTDSAADAGLVDPYGIVFNSSTGDPIDGATVRIIDDANGLPATVFGDDGVSSFPAEVTSGGSATDSSGTIYTFSPGGFRFPLMPPGDYRFVVVPAPGYLATSTVSIPILQTLPGAPFALGSGSFGNPFVVGTDLAVNLDLPLDQVAGALYLQKSTTSNVASAGDFIQFSLTVDNTSLDATIPDVAINDVLPLGFRYREGSTRMDGEPAADPVISADGRTLNFAVGNLAPDTRADIRYVVEVTVGAQGESATNRAIAVGAVGAESNEATATVQLTEDLFRSKSTLVGRIIMNSCDDDVTNDLEGVAGIRVYLEDGRYALTDEGGRFHFEGLNPGMHVVQMDLDTVPDYLEPLACEHNTRFADSTFSRFVDLKPGSLWRADFHVRERQGASGTVSLRLTSNVDDNGMEVDYAVTLAGTAVPIEDLRVTVILPDGLSYESGTARVDGAAMEEPEITGPALTWRLGGRRGAWTSRIEFGAMLQTFSRGDLTTRAVAVFDTPRSENRRTGVAENLFRRRPQRDQNRRYAVATNFDAFEAILIPADKTALDAVIADWADATDVRLVAIGHTDGTRIQPRSAPVYADNYDLSRARAQAVADYVGGALGLAEERIETVGRGPDQPVATNRTVEGRAQNRRVKLLLMGNHTMVQPSLDIVRDDSGLLTAEVNDMFARSADPEPVVDEAPKIHPVFTESGFIEHLAPGTDWVTPVAGFSPLIPSLKVAIKHAPNAAVELFLNNKPVSPLNFDSTELSADESLAVSRWRGIDLEDGHNFLLALIRDPETGEVTQLERAIHHSGGPVRGQLDPEQSRLVADGRTRPVIALRMFDRSGARAREATVGAFRVDPPYRSWWEVESLQQNQLVAVGDREPTYKVASDGRVTIELEPTTQTGEAVLHLVFPDNREQEVRVWLEPELRDWIMVGFAEGTLGYNTIKDNAINAQHSGLEEDFYEDGRLAFFGKGRIKGEFLLTLAYDSDLDEEEAKRRLHGTIDPDRFYTLYGDRTEQRFEAASREKLFVKIERKAFFALFGDYDTGLTVTELSRYSRSLSGLQSEYRGERFSYSAFASNTDMSFVKDEILGDGTSGLYYLSRRPVIINSDKVRIEVRDRFRSELVLETRELARNLDYDVDYLNGTLLMKHPVESRDANFNPTYIVVDYESQDSVDEAITAGGRAALRVPGQRLEIGATVIHEGTVGAEGNLLGADLRYRISDNAEFRAEFAYTDTETGGSGLAFLAKFDHQGERSQAQAYVVEQEPEFGLGQQMSSEAGMRKFGADARTQLTGTLSLVGSAFRQYNLSDDAQRDVLKAEVRHQVARRSAALGLMSARDEFASGQSLVSNQAFVTGSMDQFDGALTLRGTAELAFGGNPENMDYPDRALLGMDYHLTDSSTLFAEVESTNGESFESLMTRVGVKTNPWSNAQLTSTVGHETTEYGPRTFALLGLIQGWQMNEHWSFDFGLDQAKTIGDTSPRVNEAVPPASGAVTGDFLAGYAGAMYRSENWTFTSRLEHRTSDLEDRIGLFGGFYREQRDGHGFSANLQLFDTQSDGGFGNTTADLRLGWAWRPPASEWIVFDRLDLIYEDRSDGSVDLRSSRIVNNLNANWMMNRRTQLAFQYGAKYVRTNIDGAAYAGYTDLFGAGFRRDLNKRWDAGLHADVLHSWRSDVMEFGWGIDVGVTFAKNIWLSIGYNFAGFDDKDFSAGNYTAQGPFITIRMKVDQDTVRKLAIGSMLPWRGNND